MNTYFGNLITDLPLLITYGVGLYLALGRRQAQPRAAGLARWGFTLLLVEVMGGTLLTTWLINSLNTQTSNGLGEGSMQLSLLNGLSVVRVVVHTLGMALIIRALFPPLSDAVAPSWLRWVLGIVIGLVVGAATGALLGDPIGNAFGISNFEGERGYFVVFLLIPGFALAGAILGVFMANRYGRKS